MVGLGTLLSVVLVGTGGVLWAFLVLAVLARAGERVRDGEAAIAGRWVVVTGCDSGFGRAVADRLAARGARVVALCFTPAGVEAALAGGAVRAFQVDLADAGAVRAAAARVIDEVGGELWALVHNAGVVRPGFVDYQPLENYRQVMEVNFFAPVLLTQRLLPALRAARGRVVLVSSVDGLVSLPGNAPYDASKFALEGYADALRAELSLWGVSVSVVNPSTMRTPLATRFFDGHHDAWAAMEAEDPSGTWRELYPRDWVRAYVEVNAAHLDRIAQDPEHAVRDILHAVTSRRPRIRYLSGTLAKTLFWALWTSPESLSGAFKRRLIHPRPPTAGAAARTGAPVER